jgi:hypothetical protein
MICFLAGIILVISILCLVAAAGLIPAVAANYLNRKEEKDNDQFMKKYLSLFLLCVLPLLVWATPALSSIYTGTFDGTFTGNGSGLTGLNAQSLTSIGNTNASYNFFIGGAGNSTNAGNFNEGFGNNVLANNGTGVGNVAHGYNALFSNISGSYNSAYGTSTLFNNTSGSYNTALGDLAGYNITTGSSNIDIFNNGLSTDTNIIRIGSGQSDTYLAGVIHGNGFGMTNVLIGSGAPTFVTNATALVSNATFSASSRNQFMAITFTTSSTTQVSMSNYFTFTLSGTVPTTLPLIPHGVSVFGTNNVFGPAGTIMRFVVVANPASPSNSVVIVTPSAPSALTTYGLSWSIGIPQ